MSLASRTTLTRTAAVVLAGGLALTLTACGSGSKGSGDASTSRFPSIRTNPGSPNVRWISVRQS